MSYSLIGKPGLVTLYNKEGAMIGRFPCKCSGYSPKAKLKDGTEKELVHLTEVIGYPKSEVSVPLADFQVVGEVKREMCN